MTTQTWLAFAAITLTCVWAVSMMRKPHRWPRALRDAKPVSDSRSWSTAYMNSIRQEQR